MMIAALLAFTAAALPGVQDTASPPFPPTHGSDGFIQPSKDAVYLEYEGKAKALRAEMHALRRADGGELTAQHRAYMQGKLEALLSDYHRDVQRVDSMSPSR